MTLRRHSKMNHYSWDDRYVINLTALNYLISYLAQIPYIITK